MEKGRETLLTFAPDVQTDFFAPLIRLTADPSVVSRYREMAQLFRLAVDQRVATCTIHFVGLFAKVDYLVKNYELDATWVRDLHDMRHRLRQYRDLPEEELQRAYPYDLRMLCRFISLIYDRAPIPKVLKERFPLDEMPRLQRRLAAGHVRVIVERWDEHYLYVVSETTGETWTVCYQSDDVYQLGDWSYLVEWLHPGTQLNLVKPRIEQGVYYPELLIYEPDLLVDISSVAACFESYATTPLIHLLNKIKPRQTSEAILLGNFAGQLLDEAVHHQEQPYADSIRSFFQRNALEMASCPQLNRDFHVEAMMQQRHIHRLLDQVLPDEVQHFRRDELLLEPSFFCETLGIQGRMDLLQQDYNLLIEQKSGKGGFPPLPDPQVPRHQEKHYIQLLLYMALLHYQYGKSYTHLYAFLLYSKYEKGLLQLGPAPQLLFEALKIRNGIAHQELACAVDGFRCLGELEVEELRQHRVADRLWTNYVAPQLNSLLHPIRQASTLEQAYFYRFLSFIETEHLLSKMGNKSKEDAGFAAIWNRTLEEKQQAGDIYDDLQIEEPEGTGAVRDVSLCLPQDRGDDQANFRVGDVVVFYTYPEGEEPHADQTMVFRASVLSLGVERIILRLRNPQTDRRLFLPQPNMRWAVEHDFLDSSYSALYQGMYTFLTTTADRKELLLTQREPRVDTHKQLVGSYGACDELVLRAKQAEECFLVIGPPGTGKTSFALLNLVKEELLEPDSSILLLSYTNRAVDEICSKLAEEGIDFVRIGSELSCAEAYHDHLLHHRAARCGKVTEVKQLVQETRVFCGTTSAINGCSLLSLKTFTLSIIDEASQILEPHIVGLLSARCLDQVSIRKFVLIGDHKQLPAVVQQTEVESSVQDPLLQQMGLKDCRLSLFERLLKRYHSDPALVYQLVKQGRMHPEIAAFPNRYFYQNRLEVVPLEHQRENLPAVGEGADRLMALLQTQRVLFLDAPLPTASPSDKVNSIEAALIAEVVQRTYQLWQAHFDARQSIGIIVPYRNQIATVRHALARLNIPALEGITIDTVERYQGSQRDLIIYGFTIQKRYQLNFLCSHVFEEAGDFIDRKLNVVMTRARKRLVLVGHSPLLEQSGVFSRLIQFIRAEGGLLQTDAQP